MKKNITHLLKNSLDNERQSVHTKTTDIINNRFKNAEAFFEHDNIRVIKVIRDTFTFPESDHQLIDCCKIKLIKNQVSATKSEIVRAALIVLNSFEDKDLIEAFNQVEKIKTGRPRPTNRV